MWNTIENFRESLSQITSDVLDAVEELEGNGSEHPALSYSSGSEASSNRRTRSVVSSGQPEGINGVAIKQNGKENHVLPARGPANSLLPKLKELQVYNKKLQAREKDLLKELSERDSALTSLQDNHAKVVTEFNSMKEMLIKEKEELSNVKTQLQRERKLVEEANRENKKLKSEKQKISLEILEHQHRSADVSTEVTKIRESARSEALKEMGPILASKDRKVEQLQAEVHEMESKLLQLQAEVKLLRQSHSSHQTMHSEEVNNVTKGTHDSFEVERSNYEKKLAAAYAERDKVMKDLKRLRQHLLEKEQADSEKMEQDSKLIAELEEKANASMVQAMQLEQNLAQALQKQADMSQKFSEQLEASNQQIIVLKRKLAACMSASESKDSELLNLQAALGQYYAECEAKDRLHTELSSARKELDKLSDQLKIANDAMTLKDKEKEDILEKLASQQKKFSQSQEQRRKLEADVLMMRRALEQSLSRLNRMSSDSDFHVDRRIVIKLLVTYFQRQQSREVLDLMSRMLGFSDEEKQAIGLAQQGAGKGVVRGVLGLPGRFVGSLLKSGSSPAAMPLSETDDQSFSDLWIDFLLKESEEREKRDSLAADASASNSNNEPSSTMDLLKPRSFSDSGYEHKNVDDFSTPNRLKDLSFVNGPSSRYQGGDSVGSSEFSNVPLNLSPNPSLAQSYLR
ncbi:hypothetical protein KP509_25G063900 [Ceratopteris richardii]|uniref:GRIP domain-containing protein n=2 Tax=Ceratopteris richardii TaxID=49495 RepID=A0A8T2RR23_CERRI|nr:hypothetical protein KP509_25G063900 [Ceratopteris richardii]